MEQQTRVGNRGRTRWVLAAWLMLALAMPAAQAAEPQRVEKKRGTVVFYEKTPDDQFRRLSPQPEGVALEGVVASEVSGQGYVLLETDRGKLWVDRMSVKLSGTQVLARCGTVSRASDSTTAGVRGAGESCTK